MDSSTAHLIAGGVGGTVGAIITCPLEIVKVRLQSSEKFNTLNDNNLTVNSINHRHNSHFTNAPYFGSSTKKSFTRTPFIISGCIFSTPITRSQLGITFEEIFNRIFTLNSRRAKKSCNSRTRSFTISECLKYIVRTEGYRALFKGIGPTLIGVMPSRAIYFSTYHSCQIHLSNMQKSGAESSIFNTIISAIIGGIASSTLTNPIWLVKTRIQLDHSSRSNPNYSSFNTMFTIIKRIWKNDGFRGFYRGVQASYVGTLETALHFVIYENVKRRLLDWVHLDDESSDSTVDIEDRNHGGSLLKAYSDTGFCMLASACSKTIATTVMYPHEVVRTRLREEGTRYRSLVQTFRIVVQQEGLGGLYRGLGTHYMRQIPNCCIMIGVYEATVYLLNDYGLVKSN